jgi:hypothetical protein
MFVCLFPFIRAQTSEWIALLLMLEAVKVIGQFRFSAVQIRKNVAFREAINGKKVTVSALW